MSELTNRGFRFLQNRFHLKASSCPACGRSCRKVFIEVQDHNITKEIIKCKCGTIFYPDAVAPDYQIVESTSSFYLRIDQSEGIDSALRPVFFSPELQDYSVIDIGCGIGFTSDFLRFQGRECLAFDPSHSARISNKYLGIKISEEYANKRNTDGLEKKLIFCSEVIEHVENPQNFLNDLKEIAGEDGFLILTTPNSEYVCPKGDFDVINSLLAPSQHLFLLSQSSLKNLAMKVGFHWVHTWVEGERLFLIAGPRKIKIANNFDRSEYIDYLASRLENPSVGKLLRYRSFGYRLLKEYVNSAKYLKASNLWDEISRVYGELNIEIDDPNSVVRFYRTGAGPKLSLPNPAQYPYNIAILCYLKGILLIAYEHDRARATPFFEAAIEISQLYRRVYSQGILQGFDLEVQQIAVLAQDAINLHELESFTVKDRSNN